MSQDQPQTPEQPAVFEPAAQPTHPSRKPSRKKLALVSLAALTVLGLGLVLSSTLKRDKEVPPPPLAEVVVAEVQITDQGFVPQTLKVKPGTTVVWTNKEDDTPHRVASNPHPEHTGTPGLDSQENIAPKGTYSYVFDKPGTYEYHDHLNPTRNGTVVVE